MIREEKCKLAIQRGYVYDPETGFIYNRFGKLVNCENKRGYIIFGLGYGKKVLQLLGHQFAWYWVHKACVDEIDHINGIKNDNCIKNLRSVTHQQNSFNRTKIKGLNIKGYTWNKTVNKWHSSIQLNRKKIYLGLFNTEEEARKAYLAAKEKYHVI